MKNRPFQLLNVSFVFLACTPGVKDNILCISRWVCFVSVTALKRAVLLFRNFVHHKLNRLS